MPLINEDLLSRFVSDNTVNAKVLTAIIENPTGYGRIVYESDHFVGIKEDKDATDEERQIKEINSGIYLFQTRFLRSFLPKIKNENVQNEYYLTDIIKIGRDAQQNISTFLINENENLYIKGVNTPEELYEAELYLQK
jgi:bifunctional UDP-N-acetylglucosamine pyrophosphorylase/glucosamine-1-phosphate N-acetyltransferase